VTVTLAHVAGIPVEESLLTVAPTAGVLVFAIRARFGRIRGWRRRR
jgi:hypothetical protein